MIYIIVFLVAILGGIFYSFHLNKRNLRSLIKLTELDSTNFPVRTIEDSLERTLENANQLNENIEEIVDRINSNNEVQEINVIDSTFKSNYSPGIAALKMPLRPLHFDHFYPEARHTVYPDVSKTAIILSAYKAQFPTIIYETERLYKLNKKEILNKKEKITPVLKYA